MQYGVCRDAQQSIVGEKIGAPGRNWEAGFLASLARSKQSKGSAPNFLSHTRRKSNWSERLASNRDKVTIILWAKPFILQLNCFLVGHLLGSHIGEEKVE